VATVDGLGPPELDRGEGAQLIAPEQPWGVGRAPVAPFSRKAGGVDFSDSDGSRSRDSPRPARPSRHAARAVSCGALKGVEAQEILMTH